MKKSLFVIFILLISLTFGACEKLEFPEEEGGRTEKTEKNEDEEEKKDDSDDDDSKGGSDDDDSKGGSDDDDSKGGSDDDSKGGGDDDDDDDDSKSGKYHGFETLEDYFSYYGEFEHPIPFEDILKGGCLYDFYMTSAIEDQFYVASWFEEGYIVGSVTQRSMQTANFSAKNANVTNVIIAASPTTTDPSKCIPVELKSGSKAREQLNLSDNPDMLGKKVRFMGKAKKYFYVVGIKDLKAFDILE